MKFSYMQEIFLWDGVPPLTREEDKKHVEHFVESNDGIERLVGITKPSVTFYPASGRGPHPAVIVCPGGGYECLAWNHEGRDVCSMLNENGVSAFLLKYRCLEHTDGARADAARAIRLLRAKSEDFEIAPDKIGILGFSAGGHLAAITSAPADPVPYEAFDEIDKQSYRPDFSVLIYPAYLTEEGGMELKKEFRIDKDTPPSFLLQTEDDPIRVENALAWFYESKKADVKSELHLYAEGYHGYGMLRNGAAVCEWPKLAGDWIRRQCRLK